MRIIPSVSVSLAILATGSTLMAGCFGLTDRSDASSQNDGAHSGVDIQELDRPLVARPDAADSALDDATDATQDADATADANAPDDHMFVADVPEPRDVTTDTGVCPIGTIPCAMSGCVNLQTSRDHCGACGTTCPGTQMCVAGACRLDCPMPGSICGAGAMMTCLNLQSDFSNCGACGNVCALANAAPNCANGACSVSMCNAGFANCDNNVATGCEVNTDSTLAHCGGCGRACPAVQDGGSVCVAGSCRVTCNMGFDLSVDRCVASGPFPRPIRPLSLGDVSLRRPTLRWELPAGFDGAQLDLCRDRACTMVIETIRTVGSSARPTLPLPTKSVVFWRLRGTSGLMTSISFSPTWLFHVPAADNSGNIDTSANAHLDINGDGFDDVAVGAPNGLIPGPVRAGTVSVFHGSLGGASLLPTRTVEGTAADDAFGYSVASAGDVNGDGFGDLVVGAVSADPGGRMSAGTVSVFHGSATGVTRVPARVLEGIATGDLFGYSVASAGDVNGDGFSDLIVGANGSDPGGRAGAGSASVFHGSLAGIPLAPVRVLEGVNPNEFFGNAVATAGDVNGDGFGDLVVGANNARPGGRLSAGTVSVFHGSVMGAVGPPAQILEGVVASDNFGYSVASAGDVNGDGFGDLIVGSWFASRGGRRATGTISVFHGSINGLPLAAARVVEGLTADEYFGRSVASAGDVNGDGFSDVLAGANQADPGGRLNAGTVSVFHGSMSGIPMAPVRVLEGLAAGDFFGFSVASAGDVNGDGLSDLLVGAPQANPGFRRSAGTVGIYYGNLNGVAMVATRLIEGVSASDQFGSSVASANCRFWRRIRERMARLATLDKQRWIL